MHFSTLDKELDAICTKYDYGIVPGSVTVFVRDKIKQLGKLELTLLEGVMVIIEASKEGFMVTSCTPLLDTPTIPASLKLVRDHLECSFDSMDKLLMAISPHFAQRFLDQIQPSTAPVNLSSFDPLIPPLTLSLQQEQQQATPNTGNDIFQWIH